MHWPTTFPAGATASRSGTATSGRSSPVPTRLRRLAQWLAPGLGVKRWVVLMVAGIVLLSAGVLLIVNVRPLGWMEFSMFRLAVAVLTWSRGALSPSWLGVVFIGGGVLAVFDDGGSSGRLRRELGILPPGDIRDCLVALAESEPLMTQLFEYRFQGGALDGHAFGNLFIASLAGVTGDLESAVKETSKVLN